MPVRIVGKGRPLTVVSGSLESLPHVPSSEIPIKSFVSKSVENASMQQTPRASPRLIPTSGSRITTPPISPLSTTSPPKPSFPSSPPLSTNSSNYTAFSVRVFNPVRHSPPRNRRRKFVPVLPVIYEHMEMAF